MKYQDIQVGAVFSFERKITPEDVLRFAEISGDFNKLHIDKEFAAHSQFAKNIVHGMLCGSLFSCLVGMHCPGENSLYLTQSLQFKSPVFYGDAVLVRGTVVSKHDSIQMVTLRTEILKGGEIVVDGEAKVKILR